MQPNIGMPVIFISAPVAGQSVWGQHQSTLWPPASCFHGGAVGLNEIISQCSRHPDPMTLPPLPRLCRSASWEARSKMGDCQGQADRSGRQRYTCWEARISGPAPEREQEWEGGKLNSEVATHGSSERLTTWRRPGQRQGTGLCVTVDDLGPQGRRVHLDPLPPWLRLMAAWGGSCGREGRGCGGMGALGLKGVLGGVPEGPQQSASHPQTFLEESCSAGFSDSVWLGLPQQRRASQCLSVNTCPLLSRLPVILKAKAEEFETFMT